jgi:hypothetical protein
LLAAEKREMATKRDEYTRHQDDIIASLSQARANLGVKP